MVLGALLTALSAGAGAPRGRRRPEVSRRCRSRSSARPRPPPRPAPRPPSRRRSRERPWWCQVRERAPLTTGELIAEWERNAERARVARSKSPRLIARLPPLSLPAPVGRQPVGYLFDVGFTRDVWAHRMDIAVATGHPMDLDHEHDGRIMADIVAEWAATHGEPFAL